MHHYAQNPNAVLLENSLRIYFTCRPERDAAGNCVSVTSFADFEREEPFRLIGVSPRPVLPLGGPGDFDEHGIMPGSLLSMKGGKEVWLYYVGWSRMVSVPYRWSIGLAVSEDSGATFRRYSKGPIMGSSFDDPYLQACPRVLRVSDGQYLMYYASGIEWVKVGDHFESIYVTKLATSPDGIHWSRQGAQVVPSAVDKECQTSATIVSFEGQEHLFLSYRYGVDFRQKSRGYRIGYARRGEDASWVRRDREVGLDVSESGWDSEMVCYPHVVRIGGEIYMFYCGNNFGEGGFGAARLLSKHA
jgi:hypothetical protein